MPEPEYEYAFFMLNGLSLTPLEAANSLIIEP